MVKGFYYHRKKGFIWKNIYHKPEGYVFRTLNGLTTLSSIIGQRLILGEDETREF